MVYIPGLAFFIAQLIRERLTDCDASTAAIGFAAGITCFFPLKKYTKTKDGYVAAIPTFAAQFYVLL